MQNAILQTHAFSRDRSNNFVFDMSLKALQDKKKMMDRGNLVAEEDVMTKLTAIKTDKILHFYQR